MIYENYAKHRIVINKYGSGWQAMIRPPNSEISTMFHSASPSAKAIMAAAVWRKTVTRLPAVHFRAGE